MQLFCECRIAAHSPRNRRLVALAAAMKIRQQPSPWEDSSLHHAKLLSAVAGATLVNVCHCMQSEEGVIRRVQKPGSKGRRRPDGQSTAAEAQEAEDDAPTAPQPLVPRGPPKPIPPGEHSLFSRLCILVPSRIA